MFTEVLPRDLTTYDLSNRCRSTALGFMAGARTWKKRELYAWLEGAYRPLVSGRRELLASARKRMTPAWGTVVPITAARRVSEESVSTVIERAHSLVLDELRNLASGDVVAFGMKAIADRHVVRSIDDFGHIGWTPVATTHMRLHTRVLTLFAADLLLQPALYETELDICVGCDRVRFTDVSCLCRHSDTRAFVA